jgi:spore coat polysaccharide biosynthesis protein SpsF
MNVVAIIQARMASSRLPGKVLAEIDGRPMLAWVVERTRRAGHIDSVVVATTTAASDDPIAEFCVQHSYPHTRGSAYDVLDRYLQAARAHHADVIVRITADCPLLDPALVDDAVQQLVGEEQTPRFDFVANRLPPPWGRTYPIGLDVEVFTMQALEQAWHEAEQKHQREHVTPYFYEGVPAEALQFDKNQAPIAIGASPRGFFVALLHHHTDLGHHRWTVDTPQDLKLIRAIVSHFPDDTFTWLDVLSLMEREPALAEINAQVEHKTHLDVDDRT